MIIHMFDPQMLVLRYSPLILISRLFVMKTDKNFVIETEYIIQKIRVIYIWKF